jgi:hypothetical protein
VGRGGALGINGSGETHMHIDEMRFRPGAADWPSALFYCSYTFGVLDATNLNSMAFMAQGWKFLPRTGTRDPGCIMMAFDESDNDIVYATHHGNLDDGVSFLSGYDLNSVATDPLLPTKLTLAPIQLPMVQDGEIFEGLDTENGLIYTATHATGVTIYQRDPIANTIDRVSQYTGALTNAWDVLVQGNVAYVADGIEGVVVLDVTDPMNITELGRVTTGGLARYLEPGQTDVIYVALQTGGFASIDVSDPANPTILQTVDIDQTVVQLGYDGERLAIAAWNDARIYDVSDPTNMTIIGATRAEKQKNYSAEGGDEGERPDLTNRVLGIDIYGDYVFNGTWWVPHNYLLHPENVAPYLVVPETANYLAIPGDLAVGDSESVDLVLRNDGNADLTIFDVWMTNPAFTVTPAELLIPPGGSGTLTVTFTATLGSGTTVTASGEIEQTGEEVSFLEIWSDDPSQPVREAYIVGNPAGLAVGDVYTNNATLLNGDSWSFTDDALGQVTMISYFATF